MVKVTPVERWLPATGFEGFYEVSDLGQVRSVDRVVYGGRGKLGRHRGRILIQKTHPNGYRLVGLSVDAVVTTKQVAHLVLEAFRGPRPPGMESCHGPAGVGDNCVTNLRWDTHTANQLDSVHQGTHKNTSKTCCPIEHLLAAPNLVPSALPNRKCLACSRTHGNQQTAIRRGEVFDFRDAADAHYQRIMACPVDLGT